MAAACVGQAEARLLTAAILTRERGSILSARRTIIKKQWDKRVYKQGDICHRVAERESWLPSLTAVGEGKDGSWLFKFLRLENLNYCNSDCHYHHSYSISLEGLRANLNSQHEYGQRLEEGRSLIPVNNVIRLLLLGQGRVNPFIYEAPTSICLFVYT